MFIIAAMFISSAELFTNLVFNQQIMGNASQANCIVVYVEINSFILNAYITFFFISERQSLELSDCGGDFDIHCSACFEKTLFWGHTQEGELIPFTDIWQIWKNMDIKIE